MVKLIIIGIFNLNRGVMESFPQKVTSMDKDGSKHMRRHYSRKVHDTLEQETKRRSVSLEPSTQEKRW